MTSGVSCPGRVRRACTWPICPRTARPLVDRGLLARWQRLLALRDAVNVELERLRQQKTVGTSLEAAVAVRTNGATTALVERYAAELPTLFITSDVAVSADPELPLDAERASSRGAQFVEAEGVAVIEARRAEGVKCDRCWRYVPSVSRRDPAGLCNRCIDALSEAMESVG